MGEGLCSGLEIPYACTRKKESLRRLPAEAFFFIGRGARI